jgi:hypothetical protein
MHVYKDILEKWGEKVPYALIGFLNPCIYLFFLSIFFIMTSAFTPVHAVPIYIFNDLETEPEGTVLEVESVETTQSKKSRYRLKIYPGETMQISRGSVLSFSISRLYPSHKVKYQVVCPDKGENTTMSILEIHNNSIKGPCQLNKIGHWSRRTGLNWTQIKN